MGREIYTGKSTKHTQFEKLQSWPAYGIAALALPYHLKAEPGRVIALIHLVFLKLKLTFKTSLLV